MTGALLLHHSDDVAVVTRAVSKGGDVTYLSDGSEMTVRASDDIPVYHKVAIRSVKKGDTILKYGEVIGFATADIKAGEHVHTHNLTDLVKGG